MMNILRCVCVLFVTTLFLGTIALGQDQRSPISTERPSFTTDSGVVGTSNIQLELGYTYAEWEHGNTSALPEALVRYGLDEEWELRIGWDGYVLLDDDAEDFANDLDIGVKWQFKGAGEHLLWDQLDDVSMALTTTISLPTGHGPDELDFKFVLGWNYQLDDVSSLAGNLGVAFPVDLVTEDRFTQGIASIMYSRSLSDNTSWFGELYTNCPAADEQDEEYIVQAGLIHRLNDDMQIDLRLGAGLNDDAPDWLFGIGFAYRF